MARSAIAERWDVSAIIYENSPLTDQGLAIMGYLKDSKPHEIVHIYTHWLLGEGFDRLWVVSPRVLTKLTLADIYADEWVDQTLITEPLDISSILPRLRKYTYGVGIAKDIERCMRHRPEVLNNLLDAINQDVRLPKQKWAIDRFAAALIMISNPDLPHFLEFLNKQIPVVQRVITAAFLTG